MCRCASVTDMVLTHAADVSLWGGLVTETKWRSARNCCGIDLAIVGSWHGLTANRYAADTLTNARNAGLSVATYIALNSMAGAESVERGLTAAAETSDLAFAALDVEIMGVTVDIIDDAVQAARTAQLTPIIYTGGWFWAGKFGNPHNFSHLPLWTSYYDGNPDLLHNWKPYGGWTAPAAKQYEGHQPHTQFRE